MTRGITNKNPGNLNYNSYTRSLGATGVEPDGPYGKGRFAVFSTMADGICALAKNLINYHDQHGVSTVHEAIDRWAPPSDGNPTSAYVSFVCSVLKCQPDDQFDFHNVDFLFWMVTAIGEEECGHDEFTHGVSDADINAGVDAALGGV